MIMQMMNVPLMALWNAFFPTEVCMMRRTMKSSIVKMHKAETASPTATYHKFSMCRCFMLLLDEFEIIKYWQMANIIRTMAMNEYQYNILS